MTLFGAIVAGILAVAALHLARAVFIPVAVGVLISYMLEPAVAGLVRFGIPRVAAATVVFGVTLTLLGTGMYSLRHQAADVIDRLPSAAQQLRHHLQTLTLPRPLTQIQRAADELGQFSSHVPGPPDRPTRPRAAEHQRFDLSDWLWSSSTTATTLVADVIVILFLAYYLLLDGDRFRRRLVEIAGPTLSNKKITVHALNAINAQVSRFLFIRAVISVVVGLMTAAAFWALGVAQPGMWGVLAGFLNVMPYIGPTVFALAAAISAFLEFQTLTMSAAATAVSLAIAGFEAYAITPWLMSRTARMNPAAVFIGLIFWGWLWGLAGLLLAIPLLMIVKSVCEEVESLRPIAALLRV